MDLSDRTHLFWSIGMWALAAATGCAIGIEAIPAGGSGGAPGAGGQSATGGSGTGGTTAPGTGGAVTSTGGASVGSGGATGTGGRAVVTPPQFALPWMDDFESNTAGGAATGWIKNPKDVTGAWTVTTDGATKVLRESVVVSDLSMIVGGDVAWTDVKAEVKVKFAGTVSTDVLAFLVVRFVDFDNYYFLHLKGDGSMKIRKRIGGSTTDLVTYKSGTALVAGTWYTMGFAFKGATVTAFLNDAPVGTMTEAAASHPAGGIALGVQDASASFDDVKVTAP